MPSNLKSKLASTGIAALITGVGAAGVIAMPATAQQAAGGPVASASQGVIQHIQRALRIGRTANRRSVRAIRFARAAHQEAGQPGPQGPEGPQGEQGPQGDIGPTFGITTAAGAATPAADPDAVGPFTEQTIALPEAGNAFVTGYLGKVSITCSSGVPSAGLYVDGAPVEGTNRPLGNGVDTELNVAATTGELSAGEHTLQFKYDCPNGDVDSSLLGTPVSYTVILLGG